MSLNKTNSAQNIIYIDYSTSASGAFLNQTSADPHSLVNVSHKIVLFAPRKLELIIRVAKEKPKQ